MSAETESQKTADMAAILDLMQSMKKDFDSRLEAMAHKSNGRSKPEHIGPRKSLKGKRGIGGIIEKLSSAKGLNQTDFAKSVGLDNTHISFVEKKDDYNLPLNTLKKIAKGLELTASELVAKMEARDAKMIQS